MKYCPRCSETYKDENLNFCLNDGELLNQMNSEEAAPTVMLDSSRVTNDWGDQDTNFSDFNQENQQIYQQPFTSPMPVMASGQDKTLPTIGVIVGAIGLVFSCCSFGVFLGPVAAILGYIGLNNINKNPETYGGRELAVIAMILGGISFVVGIIILLFNILGAIAG